MDKCSICVKESFMGGITVPYLQITESGELIDAYTNSQESLQITIPLCGYHLVWATKGLVSVVKYPDGDRVVFPQTATVNLMESLPNKQLKNGLEVCKKNESKEQYKTAKLIVQAIKEGRLFESKMQGNDKIGN